MQIVINIPDENILDAFSAAAKQVDQTAKPDLLTNPEFQKELADDVTCYLNNNLTEFFFNGMNNDLYTNFTE